MRPAFDATTVLDFRPRGAGPAGVRDRWRLRLLWPAWEFRVLAPVPRERSLNVFERAALGLCRTGVVSASEVAGLLGFDEELAARVLLDLRLKGLLDEFGVPTEKGRSSLGEADVTSSEDYEVCYVYRDPQSGSLFPRVTPTGERTRALVDAEVDERGRILLPQGSIGNRKSLRPFMVAPDAAVSHPPTPDEVLDASVYHARAFKSHRKRSSSGGDDEPRTLSDAESEEQLERRHRAVKKVDLVDDTPQAVWLYTYAHHAADAPGHAEAWTVCDPFGLGDSRSLLERVRSRAATLPPLQDRIDERTGRAKEQKLSEARALDELRVLDAAQTVAERLGTDLPGPLEQHLRWMEVHLEAGRAGGAFKLRSALVEAQSAGEALLRVVLRDVDGRIVSSLLKVTSRGGRHVLVNEMAARVGLQTPIPESVSGQNPGAKACRGLAGSLRAHLVAAICAADQSTDHPLHRAARGEPSLVQLLDAVAALRNEHGGHAGPPPSVDEAFEAAQNVYRACEALLPHL